MGDLPSSVRQAPMALKFSTKAERIHPRMQEEHTGFLRCSSICCLNVAGRPLWLPRAEARLEEAEVAAR